jgi:hypothetical protein
MERSGILDISEVNASLHRGCLLLANHNQLHELRYGSLTGQTVRDFHAARRSLDASDGMQDLRPSD